MTFIKHTVGSIIRRKFLIPFYWKYINRSKVLHYYGYLKKLQWNSMEENRKLQKKKLFALIEYASRNIPYYQQIVRDYDIRFDEETIFEDLKKFPLLTKDIIRNHFSDLYRFKDKTYYRNTSSGSTGEPAVFYQDKEYLDWANASKRLFNEWAGRKIGEPMLRLWGSPLGVILGGHGFRGYIRKQISGITTINSRKMNERDMYNRLKCINKITPILIYGYVNVIDAISHFIKKNQLFVHSPKAVMTTAGVLYPEVKDRIKEIFNAPVFNRYGSREVSILACNCEKDRGLHLLPNLHYLEILNDEERPVKFGMSGNIVVTLLTNYTMPLIRYKIGDRGVLSNNQCNCGRGFPLLEKVEGRVTDGFRNKFGDYIWGGIFFRFFCFHDNIKQFQIIQKDFDVILVNLVLDDKNEFKNMHEFLLDTDKKICKIMGHDTEVLHNVVDEIEPGPSGKLNLIFSEIDKRSIG